MGSGGEQLAAVVVVAWGEGDGRSDTKGQTIQVWVVGVVVEREVVWCGVWGVLKSGEWCSGIGGVS